MPTHSDPTADLLVWGAGTSRTFRVYWMLEELGLEYTVRPIGPRTGETQTPEYLALNPRGKIPVLEDGDLVLAESGAIINHLAESRGGEQGLVPPQGTRERALYDQWCFFILMELDATSLYVMRRHRDLSDVYGTAPHAVQSSATYFQRQVSVVEEELDARGPYLLGRNFTAADLLLVSCLDWAIFYQVDLTQPLLRYRTRATDRAAYRRAVEANYPRPVADMIAKMG